MHGAAGLTCSSARSQQQCAACCRGINALLDTQFGPGFDAQAKRQLLSAALQPLEDWVGGFVSVP